MEGDHIDALEQTVIELWQMEKANNTTMQEILALLRKKEPTTTEKPNIQSSTIASVAEPSRPRTARPAVPPEFDGDREKGTAFFNACQTYIWLCPKEFQDEQTKIMCQWAMSYMKSS
jgi:hypothetical protein